ncbi:MAG: sugar phosphate isomerase/epimerase family protein [Anaerolineae bacterium]|jgi:sugar phosphate isomerase/epimerase
MKIGFLTACLRGVKLEDIVTWAGANGFQTLELTATPIAPGRPADNVLDVANLNREKADALKELCTRSGIEISCLTYCDNNLAADPEKRAQVHGHLRKVIDAANLLGVREVSTFVGRNHLTTIEENIEEAVPVFRELLAYAADRGVRLGIENWPGFNVQFEGLIGNIFMSPAIWEPLFEALPVDNFGLNFDPSHLYWQGIDYIQATKDFSERIFHVHTKDTEVFDDVVQRAGMFLPRHRWWRYRIPGMGAIDWPGFISALTEYGYDGPLSTEHEDPVWSGSEEKVKQGLLLAKKYLSTYVV